MCERKADWSHQVPMPINGKVRCIDECIADIVAALSAGGVATVASCCGHGKRPAEIILEDGRRLFIAADIVEALSVSAAFSPLTEEPQPQVGEDDEEPVTETEPADDSSEEAKAVTGMERDVVELLTAEILEALDDFGVDFGRSGLGHDAILRAVGINLVENLFLLLPWRHWLKKVERENPHDARQMLKKHIADKLDKKIRMIDGPAEFKELADSLIRAKDAILGAVW